LQRIDALQEENGLLVKALKALASDPRIGGDVNLPILQLLAKVGHSTFLQGMYLIPSVTVSHGTASFRGLSRFE
jgi:hypothetical protein